MPFAQLIIGPPGSGKTTYCNGMSQFLNLIGRKNIIVNLDPANEYLPYTAAIDIKELSTVNEVMKNLNLGPNGGLIYAMEYLEKNLDWLKEKLSKYPQHYVLFDFPGQVELYSHYNTVKKIMEQLEKWSYRLCAVHLVDAHYCSDPGKFISVVLLALSTMMRLEMPHINVLSKIDLIEQLGDLDFNLDFYLELNDLGYLLKKLNSDPYAKKYSKLNEALVEVIHDFDLVNFKTLNIQDKESVFKLLKEIDRVNGYAFSGLDEKMLEVISKDEEWDYEKFGSTQEKYVKQKEDKNDKDNNNNNNNKMDEEKENFNDYWDNLLKQLNQPQTSTQSTSTNSVPKPTTPKPSIDSSKPSTQRKTKLMED